MLSADKFTGVNGQLQPMAELAGLTWMRVGGPADWLFTPADISDLQNFLRQCPEDVPITCLGAGSNSLIRDGGMDGIVIHLAAHLTKITHTDNEIYAEAGCADSEVARYAAKQNLTGLEFLVSIPGTIGGGIVMNAGCYGTEFKDVLIEGEGLTHQGEQVNFSAADLQLSYRRSQLPADIILTSARFRAEPGDNAVIRQTMKQMLANRAASQPVGVRTGGSTFANPDGGKAWQQIDAAGCRGLQRGGASVSEKHCNFLINQGTATAADIEELGEEVRAAVAAHSGTKLRWEIRRMGRPLSKQNANGGADGRT
ncbi:UDP-N-acetylenolpyruvoylglucosamine reductase [SAR116 cluster alpha proteobacterium HIMB100]|nr:UDP-N-acetylenolpyruvoylglucosamine reductase [SAR116 cluster alpha proteobacterium HIMB100]